MGSLWYHESMMMMRVLMEDFEDMKSPEAFEYNAMMDTAVSIANNCHQMTSEQVLSTVRDALVSIRDNPRVTLSEAQHEALADALIIVALRDTNH